MKSTKWGILLNPKQMFLLLVYIYSCGLIWWFILPVCFSFSLKNDGKVLNPHQIATIQDNGGHYLVAPCTHPLLKVSQSAVLLWSVLKSANFGVLLYLNNYSSAQKLTKNQLYLDFCSCTVSSLHCNNNLRNTKLMKNMDISMWKHIHLDGDTL